MIRSIKAAAFILLLFTCAVTSAQVKVYTAANAHAHNDYINDTPFYRAYRAGFGSIEADVYPVNEVLLVAHDKSGIRQQRTLKALYLIPLFQQLQSDTSRRLSLLVDIKQDYKTVLPLLVRELEPLKRYLSAAQTNNRLTVIISGTRPPPGEYKNYPAYIFFDDDLKLRHTTEQWKRIGLVSLPFYLISRWNGEGSPEKKDVEKLRHTIDSVHTAGKRIRFWAAPDTITSWKLQMELHADLIGTDKIDELSKVLK